MTIMEFPTMFPQMATRIFPIFPSLLRNHDLDVMLELLRKLKGSSMSRRKGMI